MLSSFPPHVIAGIVAVILLSLIIYPLAIHLFYGWKRKSDDILLAMSNRSAQLYFKAFQNTDVDLKQALEKFTQFYHAWYGRQLLIFPICGSILVATFSVYMLGESGEIALRRFSGATPDAKDYFALPLIATSAIAGAYAFVIWDIIGRVAKRNLGPTDILGAAIRLAIAIPLGYSFSALLKDDLGPFIAFAAGAFPLQTGQTALQRLANKQLGLEMGADSAVDQVTRLSGIDQPTADRIEDADITTIAELAYCDPVQLSMRTHLPFAYISDIVAQALAWIYFEDRLKKLRPIGLRGALEFRTLFQWAAQNSKKLVPDAKAATDSAAAEVVIDLGNITSAFAETALALIPKAAKAVDMSEVEFLNVALQIAYDPYTQFLYETCRPEPINIVLNGDGQENAAPDQKLPPK
jgi:hypothetical protein